MISREEIDNLATLARLKLTDAEAEALQKDISNILEYVGQISSTSAGASAAFPGPRNVMRADVPREAGDVLAGKEDALRAAFPKREGDFAAVRKIIDRE